MQYGVAVKARHADARGWNALPIQQLKYEPRMHQRQVALERVDRGAARFRAEHAPQPLPHRLFVRDGDGAQRADMAVPVGFEDRRIDAVERGAAHQA